jgi:hypothetical protein
MSVTGTFYIKAVLTKRRLPQMYDRDYVKMLEREIELNGDNRFEGWCLSSEKANVSEPIRPKPTKSSAAKAACT